MAKPTEATYHPHSTDGNAAAADKQADASTTADERDGSRSTSNDGKRRETRSVACTASRARPVKANARSTRARDGDAVASLLQNNNKATANPAFTVLTPPIAHCF